MRRKTAQEGEDRRLTLTFRNMYDLRMALLMLQLHVVLIEIVVGYSVAALFCKVKSRNNPYRSVYRNTDFNFEELMEDRISKNKHDVELRC